MSIAFAVITQTSHTPIATSDAKETKYVKVADILEKKIEKRTLAFDHNKILEDALSFMVNQMALKPIALDFCDNKFTIGDIRAVYESFWKLTHNIDSIELGNFQNKILKQVDQDGNPVINPMPNKPENKAEEPIKKSLLGKRTLQEAQEQTSKPCEPTVSKMKRFANLMPMPIKKTLTHEPELIKRQRRRQRATAAIHQERHQGLPVFKHDCRAVCLRGIRQSSRWT